MTVASRKRIRFKRPACQLEASKPLTSRETLSNAELRMSAAKERIQLKRRKAGVG